MVHSEVGVNHGVLHEAAVLVDLLLGDLRFRGRVSRRAILASRRRRGGCSGVAAAAWELFWRRGGGVAGGFEISGQCRLGAHADSTLGHATWGSYTGCGAALSMRCWRATLRKAGRARLSSMVLFFFWLRRAWPELSCYLQCTYASERCGTKV